MSEEVKPKKKLSKFGQVWIAVCVMAVALAVLVMCVGPIASAMESYNNHVHDDDCYYTDWSEGERYQICSYSYYDNAFFYALDDCVVFLILFVAVDLIVANVVMLICWALRKGEGQSVAFSRVWFVSLTAACLISPIACFVYWSGLVKVSLAIVDELMMFLMGYDVITPKILMYIVLTIVWTLGRKKWDFHGKWVGISYLAYGLSRLLLYLFVGRGFGSIIYHLLIVSIIEVLPIVAAWIAYVRSLKKPKEQPKPINPVTYAEQLVYYSPAAYLGDEKPTAAATAVGDAAIPVEQLNQLQALRDNGVITQEEFDAKKKQLLGL